MVESKAKVKARAAMEKAAAQKSLDRVLARQPSKFSKVDTEMLVERAREERASWDLKQKVKEDKASAKELGEEV